MATGLLQYPIGELRDTGTHISRVVLFTPAASDLARSTQVRYHNMLMDLCQVSARKFLSLLMKKNAEEEDGGCGQVPFFFCCCTCTCPSKYLTKVNKNEQQ